MFHRLFLFFFCLLWPNLVAAEDLLQLNTSYPEATLSSFVSRLEGRLETKVKLAVSAGVDARNFSSPAGSRLWLLPEGPGSARRPEIVWVGLVPIAGDKVANLYRSNAFPVKWRAALQRVVDQTLLEYRPQGTGISGLASVAEAVTAARKGSFSQALSYLYPYLDKHPRDARAFAETLVVLEWAGQSSSALALALSRADLELPLYAIKSLLRSARAGGYFKSADDYLQLGLNYEPGDPELLALQGHLLADLGRHEEGLQKVSEALKHYPQYADLWLAKYYLHVVRAESYDALDAIQRANKLAPSRYARRELLYSLERSGMPQQALLLLKDDPDLLTDDEIFRLRRAEHAMQVRWGVYQQPAQEQYYRMTDQALRQNETLRHELATGEFVEQELHQRILKFDRLVALRDRKLMRKVVAEWELLKAEEVVVPDYALQAIADALLYLQRPDEAAPLYRAVAQKNRRNASAWLGLYYSLHEANHYAEATELIESLSEGEATWNRTKGYRQPETNLDRFRYDLAAGLDRLYRNEHALAEERLRPLFEQAPHNPELRQAYAELERARRHPRRGQALVKQGLAVNPKHRGLQVGLADSYLERRQWRLAERSIHRLGELFPDEGSTVRLQDDWQRRNLRILEGRISFGYGDSPTVAGREIDWLLRNWTRPLDYDWRLALFGLSRHADLPEGRTTRSYAGLAAQRLTPDLSLFAQLGLADSSNDQWLAELSGRYEFNDRWAVLFSLAHNAEAVSLRALETGSSGIEYQLGVEWWRHESLAVTADLSLLDYSDGNQRLGVSAAVRKRLLAGPIFQLENVFRLAGSSNSSSVGAYFAPETDFLVENEWQGRWITWREYADTFTQRFSASVGGYWQQDFNWSVPFALSYAHEWELQRRRLFVEYGPSYSYRYYDGEAETNLGMFLAFVWRY
jgi:biofilm PGA synthesis protein PgaA